MATTKPQRERRAICVAGDVTIDWNLAHAPYGSGDGRQWTAADNTRACPQIGGAALLRILIEAAALRVRQSGGAEFHVGGAEITGALTPGDERSHHSYALWEPAPSGGGSASAGQRVWRVSKFLGIDRAAHRISPGDNGPSVPSGDPTQPAIIVLDDAGLGFRDESKAWDKLLESPGADHWIVLKMSQPLACGKLWEETITKHADRLILVITADDLRLSEVQISRQLSWERTAQDLFWELLHNPRVNGAAHARYVVVSFCASGVFLLTRHASANGEAADGGSHWRAELCFDPLVAEGCWQSGRVGKLLGYTGALTASIVYRLMLDGQHPQMHAAIQSGVAAMRRLFNEGYGPYVPDNRPCLEYPLEAIVDELTKDAAPLCVAQVQNPVEAISAAAVDSSRAAAGQWSILESRKSQPLDEIAEQIVLCGLRSALRAVPIGVFGKLQTVDRREIEALRSIQNLITEYVGQPQKRPLSIAVFGPPGSGKSFGVEQVANSLGAGAVETLTFNLSQFGRLDEFFGALHQVRDASLRGKLPLVFWDEFDTALDGKPLGWLRYFLAPMQDGSFQQGEVVHPIGRSIFVFAGGTSHQLAGFGAGLADPEDYKAAKVPDFLSRLKGYLNVLGPNCQSGDGEDPFFIVRRAILLRSIFERGTPHLLQARAGSQHLNIDRGVLRALLGTRQYKHGARSIESIINMSSLAGKSNFERSSLPPAAQLDLHVNGLEFLAIVQQIELSGEVLQRLAAAAHEVYCDGKRRDGWTLGEEKNAERKTHPWLCDFGKLPPEAQEANRVTVRNIPKKLARAGYVMLPSRSNEPAFDFPGGDLEALAEYEHELWLEGQAATARAAGSGAGQHEHAVPWAQLPDNVKQIDRDLVRGIPTILARAGYAVMRINNVTSRQ